MMLYRAIIKNYLPGDTRHFIITSIVYNFPYALRVPFFYLKIFLCMCVSNTQGPIFSIQRISSVCLCFQSLRVPILCPQTFFLCLFITKVQRIHFLVSLFLSHTYSMKSLMQSIKQKFGNITINILKLILVKTFLDVWVPMMIY